MTPPAESQPAFVLHKRAFRETSVVVELLSREFGRVGGVVRGAKGRRRRTHHIEPFAEVSATWRGNGELVNVLHCELVSAWPLRGDRLFAGLYMNELLIKMLNHGDPCVDLFAHYQRALALLSSHGAGDTPGNGDLEPVLRAFERRLLDETGYGLTFDVDVRSGRPIQRNATYRLVPGEGFSALVEPRQQPALTLTGAQIAAIDQGEFGDDAIRKAAKRVFRGAVALRLGNRRLATRDLFAARAVAAHATLASA